MGKTIALIAHDGKKDGLVRLARQLRDDLAHFRLIATGTTGARVWYGKPITGRANA